MKFKRGEVVEVFCTESKGNLSHGFKHGSKVSIVKVLSDRSGYVAEDSVEKWFVKESEVREYVQVKPESEKTKNDLRIDIMNVKQDLQLSQAKVFDLQNDLNQMTQKKESIFNEKLLLKKEIEMTERVFMNILKGLGYDK